MSKKQKLTIVQAILEVLKQENRPMSSQEVYDAIIKYHLYEFGAINPQHIVNSQIRRHCKGLETRKSYSKTKYFEWRPEYNDKYFYLKEVEVVTDIVSLDKDSDSSHYHSVLSIKQWFLSEYKPIYDRSTTLNNSEYIDLIDDPYSTLDILRDQYLEVVDLNILTKVTEDLEKEFECVEWFKIPKDRDIENYYLDNIDTDFFKEFQTSLKQIMSLSRPINGPYTIKPELEESLNRMLYANIITAMETYLSDALTQIIFSNQEVLRTFIKKTKEFQEQKISFSDIFIEFANIDRKVRDYFTGLPFHKLNKVGALYKSTLNVEFPKDLSAIYKAIMIRHDIVHLNGRKRGDKSYHQIGYKDIQSLSSEVKHFLKLVDKQLQPYKADLKDKKSRK